VKKRFRKTTRASRIGNGWRDYKKTQTGQDRRVPQSLAGEEASLPEVVSKARACHAVERIEEEEAIEFERVGETGAQAVEADNARVPWQYNGVAGSFLL